MGRFVGRLLPITAKSFHPDIANPSRRQRLLQRFAIELGQSARHGEGSDIDECFDLVCAKRGDQFLESSCGVADSVEGRQCTFDAESGLDDAAEGFGDSLVLLRKYSSQIYDYAAFVDPDDDGRV